jgi:hypothetical protein
MKGTDDDLELCLDQTAAVSSQPWRPLFYMRVRRIGMGGRLGSPILIGYPTIISSFGLDDREGLLDRYLSGSHHAPLPHSGM